MFADDAEIMKIAETELKSLNTQMETLRKEITEYESAIKAAEALKDGAVEKLKSQAKQQTPVFLNQTRMLGKSMKSSPTSSVNISKLPSVLPMFNVC